MLAFTLEGGNGVDWQYKVFDLYDNSVFAQFGPYLASFAVYVNGENRTVGATLDIAYINFYSFEHGVDCVEWTYDENGHSRTACPDCGKEALNNAPHNYTSIDQTTNEHVCECGYRFACSEWTYDENGHSHPACAACGTEAVENKPHKFTTYNAERNAYLCECGYGIAGITLNDSVSHIARPDTMMEDSGYNVLSDIKVENGVIYRSQTGHVASADNGGYVFGLKLNDDDIHVIGARYIVIKLRTNVPVNNFHSWQLHFNGGSGNIGLATTAFTAGEWTTLVIDMSNYGHGYYKPGENGAYPEFSQFLLLPWASKGDYSQYTLDVAYIATVKDTAGVIALVGDDTIMLQAQGGSATEMTADAFCALSHAYVNNNDGTHNTPACERCGLVSEKVAHEFVYDADTNTHICVCGAVDPIGHSCTDNGDGTHTIASCAHCKINGATEEHKHAYDAESTMYVCVCGNTVGKTFSSNIEYVVRPGELALRSASTYSLGIFVDDDGTVYQKIGDSRSAGNNFFEFGIGKGENIRIKTGRYFVMKVRSSAPVSSDAHYRFWMDGDGKGNSKMIPDAVFSGDWVIYILDLEACFPAYYVKDANGEYPWMAASTFIGGWSNSAFKDSSMDVAYLAIVDSIDDIVELLENEKEIYFSTSTGTAESTDKSNLCGKVNNHSYTINSDGTHTAPSCDKCGLVGGVTETHNYQKNSAGEYACACGKTIAAEFYAGAHNITDRTSSDLGVHTEDGVTYHSFGPNGDGSATGFKVSGIPSTDSKYIVIKMRTNATTSSWQSWLWLMDSEIEGGWTRFKVQESMVSDCGWVTFVIDLEKACPGAFGADGNMFSIDEFGFAPVNYPVTADTVIDVAYIALFADLADVVDVIDQGTVVYQEANDGNGNCSVMTPEQLAALGQTAE
jgi:hypothetical protein